MREATIDLFAYGTLRPGGLLYDSWFADSIVSSKRAVTSGRMYSVGSYPVVFFDQPGQVIGDVCTLRVTYDVIDCMRMESRAGYMLVEVDYNLYQYGVRCNDTERAYAFHCLPKQYTLQHQVMHGDWLLHEREMDDAHHGEGTITHMR